MSRWSSALETKTAAHQSNVSACENLGWTSHGITFDVLYFFPIDFWRFSSTRFLWKKNSNAISIQFPVQPTESEPSHYWVGRRSLLRWHFLARDYANLLFLEDGPNATESKPRGTLVTKFNTDVLCPHGKLRVCSKSVCRIPAALWHRLVALFPGAVIPTFPAVLDVPYRDAVSGSSNDSTSEKIMCSKCELLESSLIERAFKQRQSLSRIAVSNVRRRENFSINPLHVSPDMEQAEIRTMLVNYLSLPQPSGLLSITLYVN